MEKIKDVVKQLRESHDYSSIMVKTIELILNDKMNSMELNQCLSDEKCL